MLLGIKKKLHSEHHNILFSNNYNNEFKDLFVKKIFPDDPTVYLCNPVVTDIGSCTKIWLFKFIYHG